MNSTHISDNIESEVTQPLHSKKPLEFSSFLMEESEKDCGEDEVKAEEKDAEIDDKIVLMDGPYVAPLIPPQMIFLVSKLIASLPEELRPLIEPLPAEIRTSFKTGIIQTKMIIALSPLENVEVVIDQYDTAPSSFHISFYGSEQTGEMISLKQNELINILQTALPNFSFAISPPFIAAPSFSLPKSKRLGYSPVNRGKRLK